MGFKLLPCLCQFGIERLPVMGVFAFLLALLLFMLLMHFLQLLSECLFTLCQMDQAGFKLLPCLCQFGVDFLPMLAVFAFLLAQLLFMLLMHFLQLLSECLFTLCQMDQAGFKLLPCLCQFGVERLPSLYRLKSSGFKLLLQLCDLKEKIMPVFGN